MRFDYIYTRYRNQSSFINQSFQEDGTTSILTENARVRLRDHAIQLGLSYYFSQCPCFCCLNERCSAQFCGFYLAGSIGATLMDARVRDGTLVVTKSIPQTINYPKHVTDTSFNGTMYGGYSVKKNCLFLAAEGFVQYSNLKRTRRDFNEFLLLGVFNANSITEIQIRPWQYGIQLRPGVLISRDVDAFGTVGGTHARIRANSTVTLDLDIPGTVSGSTSLSFKDSRNRFCLRAGGGVEVAFAPSCHLRADYVFTDYGKLSFVSTAERNIETVQIPFFENRRFHLYSHALTLGFVKYF